MLGRVQLVTLEGRQAREGRDVHRRGERTRAGIGGNEREPPVGCAAAEDVEEDGIARDGGAGRYDQRDILSAVRRVESRGRVEDGRVGTEIDDRASVRRGHDRHP
ncbi:MAG: hypothetical protein E6H84_08215 [Chloroflexi bacterium]|nr:MAG: hypothetical protein E6H84_08215 [Chloroflexota bacterium]